MRHYETTIILPPNLPEEEMDSLASGVEEDLSGRFNAVNVSMNKWGKRTLSYPIRKFNDGVYVFYEYDSESDETVSGLETRLRLNENVLRFLTVRRDLELKSEASMKARFIKQKKHAEVKASVAAEADRAPAKNKD